MIMKKKRLDGLAIVLVTVVLFILLFFLFPSQLVKRGGDILAIIPDKLGLVHRVQPTEVRPLKFLVGNSVKEWFDPGKYLVFADSVELFMTGTLGEKVKISAKELIEVRGIDGKPAQSLVTSLERGVRPYDTPAAAGRPIFRIDIKEAGSYGITSTVGGDIRMSIVPDRASGREYFIAALFLIQIAILLSPLCAYCAFRLRKSRTTQRRLQKEQRFRADQLMAMSRDQDSDT
jgi:hypothetical protein